MGEDPPRAGADDFDRAMQGLIQVAVSARRCPKKEVTVIFPALEVCSADTLHAGRSRFPLPRSSLAIDDIDFSGGAGGVRRLAHLQLHKWCR